MYSPSASLTEPSMATSRQENAILSQALNAFGSAVMVVSDDRTVRYANRAAQELATVERAYRFRMGRLVGTVPSRDRQLHAAICAACREPSRGSAFRLPYGSEVLQVQIVTLGGGRSLEFTGNKPVALVIMANLHEQHPSPELMRQLFDLTGAEARLVSALARGQSLDRIAALNGISKNTVRSQLASVFGKTGATSQAQLVVRARTLPNLVSLPCAERSAMDEQAPGGADRPRPALRVAVRDSGAGGDRTEVSLNRKDSRRITGGFSSNGGYRP